ncbi:MAG: glycosyltransferase family 2 protein [Rhodothermales bacterium]
MVYVVTPVFNRKAITQHFLACLQQQDYPDIRTVIVDDGSSDGTSDMIRAEFPTVDIIAGDGNLWWTGGTNAGLRHVLKQASDDDFVLIINDDLEFDRTYVSRLVAYARQHPRTLVGSVVVDIETEDTIWDGGRITNWFTAKDRVLHVGKRLSEFAEDHAVEVSQLTGRGMLAPVSVFKEIGLYDEVHFKHRGDTEFPVRAARRGYRQVVYYSAVVRSHVNKTYEFDVKEVYRLSDARRYFFDFRSSFWVKFRFYFALKTATSPIQFLSFFTCDMIRVTVHFLKRLRLTA